MGEKKKSMLFVCYGMGIGGIEKCLVNLLNVMPEEKYEVDLMLVDPLYDMLPQIRRSYHLVDSFLYTLNAEFTLQESRKRGGLWRHREKLLPYVEYRIRSKLGLPNWIRFKSLEKNYDIAVAYSHNGLGPYYMIDKVRAERKVLWYHNGAYDQPERQYALDRRYFVKFDQVVAVSSDCAEVLRKAFPQLDEKILVLHNICDAEAIRTGARAFVPEGFDGDSSHIVTIGRLSREKGAEIALEACRQLCAQGRKICWHWVGSGDDAADMQKKIDALGLQGRFVLEGNQTNPYPYLYHGDIYVQPSYYEAYSTTVTEARVLRKPIVTTDVGGMRDQLRSGETGLIVPIDAGAIAEAVGKLLDDDILRISLARALEEESFDGERLLREYEQTVFL